MSPFLQLAFELIVILRDDLPLMPSLDDFYDREEELSRTLFTVVKDKTTVKRVLAATRGMVGDLDRPDTGLRVVLPVRRIYGLRGSGKEAGRNS